MEQKTETALEKAIKVAGGMTQMARDLDLSGHATVYQWKKNQVPAEKCPDIEALTGIKCEDLRPDVNWAVLRGANKATAWPLTAACAARQ